MKYTKNHKVYYNDDKKEVPSVTTILKILNKPALIKWGNYLGFKGIRVEDELSATAQLGTRVHSLINSFMEKKYIIYIHTSNQYSKLTVYRCLNNFMKWYKVNTVEPIFMEKKFTSDEFGGTLDFYGKVNDKYTIVDYKTSKKIRLSMFIQLALYCVLLEVNGHQVDQVGIVLVNDKSPDNKFISREELNPYIDFAKVLVTLFHKYYDLDKIGNWNESLI